MASIELVFRGGTELKTLDPMMTAYVHPSLIKAITLGENVAYILDKDLWSYKFIKENNEWTLEKVNMKRRYGNGRYKTSTRRHDERKRNTRWTNYKA